MNHPQTVDDYIAAAPAEVQERLRTLRALIKAAAPGAAERISYGMPFYDYHDRLVYFAYAKQHIGGYALFPDEEQLRTDLAGYSTAKGAIRFPNDQELPLPLIRKLVEARARKLEAEAAAKPAPARKRRAST